MHEPISLLFQDARDTGLVPGETLFATGEDVADIFMVRSGRVHLHHHTTHGVQMVLQNAGPGGVVAEASAYSSRCHCDAIAAEDSVVAGMPKQRLLSALANHPALATSWFVLLARSVQAARLRSEIRSLPRVADRLDAWLGEGNTLPEKGRWQEVAAELSITRETLYRELGRRRGQRRMTAASRGDTSPAETTRVATQIRDWSSEERPQGRARSIHDRPITE